MFRRALTAAFLMPLALVGFRSTPAATAAEAAPVTVSAPSPAEVLPWTAAIVWKADGASAEDPVCSGSVVAPTWVLTAGHCQATAVGQGVEVAVITGRPNLTSTRRGQYLTVDRAVRMPGWGQQGFSYANDLTLLHLSKPTRARPVALATPRQMHSFTQLAVAVAAGWGALAPEGEPVSTVHTTTLERLPNSVCAKEYGGQFDAATQVCGGWKWPSMDHDTCNGDSGGPLALKIDGKVYEVATTSWGSTCLTEGVPGVYSRVGAAYDWIARTISRA